MPLHTVNSGRQGLEFDRQDAAVLQRRWFSCVHTSAIGVGDLNGAEQRFHRFGVGQNCVAERSVIHRRSDLGSARRWLGPARAPASLRRMVIRTGCPRSRWKTCLSNRDPKKSQELQWPQASSTNRFSTRHTSRRPGITRWTRRAAAGPPAGRRAPAVGTDHAGSEAAQEAGARRTRSVRPRRRPRTSRRATQEYNPTRSSTKSASTWKPGGHAQSRPTGALRRRRAPAARTGVTTNSRASRPFFCQVEAVETAIWLTEVARKRSAATTNSASTCGRQRAGQPRTAPHRHEDGDRQPARPPSWRC